MRRWLVVPGLALLAAVPLQAQEYPKLELFSGFSYLNSEGSNLFGWQSDFNINFRERLGITADLSGQFGSESGFNIGEYQYLFGPRLNLRTEKYTAFVHALFGGARFTVGGGGSASGFAMAFGGGVDLNLGDNYALRVAQVDYLPARIVGVWGNQVRIGTGFVLRIGTE